ncbi:MAG: hypothetical protein HY645_06935 [Acidobacteria bacterium]|nr:hypothetical protein [Acidobacteriota bacterium]
MKIEKGMMVALGYGKYFRSDNIVGIEPIEEGRGPGRRTKVYVDQLKEPVTASRSQSAILSDLVQIPKTVTRTVEQHQLLNDILDTISEVNPILRSIIRDQGNWDLDQLERRIRELLKEDEEPSE